MTRDQLDELLDAAAPAARTIAPEEVRVLVLDARAQAAPQPPRAKKTALVTGVLALLMVGGARVATASSDWYLSRRTNPDDAPDLLGETMVVA
ncbi:hypothetical protein [Microbacterium sp. GXF0217]